MTRLEWLTTDRFSDMLALLYESPILVKGIGQDRRWRLLACAICRQFWPLLFDERSRAAVETSERFAEGLATAVEMVDSWTAGHGVVMDVYESPARFAAYMAGNLGHALAAEIFRPNYRHWPEGAGLAPSLLTAILRDIMGDPFDRLVRLTQKCPICQQNWIFANRSGGTSVVCTCGHDFYVFQEAWLTPTVLDLAKDALADLKQTRCFNCDGVGDRHFAPGKCPICHGDAHFRRPILDNFTLLALADALEEAGCQDYMGCPVCHARGFEEFLATIDGHHERIPCSQCRGTGNLGILSHLRSSGTHVRGSWPLDLILGKF